MVVNSKQGMVTSTEICARSFKPSFVRNFRCAKYPPTAAITVAFPTERRLARSRTDSIKPRLSLAYVCARILADRVRIGYVLQCGHHCHVEKLTRDGASHGGQLDWSSF
eukprot:1187044-Prorocentrum_minimum.AAC.4